MLLPLLKYMRDATRQSQLPRLPTELILNILEHFPLYPLYLLCIDRKSDILSTYARSVLIRRVFRTPGYARVKSCCRQCWYDIDNYAHHEFLQPLDTLFDFMQLNVNHASHTAEPPLRRTHGWPPKYPGQSWLVFAVGWTDKGVCMNVHRLMAISEMAATRKRAGVRETDIEAKENMQLLLVEYYFEQRRRARHTKYFLRVLKPWKRQSQRTGP